MGSGQDSLLRQADEQDGPGPAQSRRSEFGPVDYGTLETACRRLTASELEVALRDRYLPVAFAPEPAAYVAAGPAALAAARALGRPVVGHADPRDLVEALQAVYGGDICGRAAGHLVHAVPEFSARWRISPFQAAAVSVAAAAFIVLWHFVPGIAAIVASLGFGVVFLAVCGIRLLGLLPAGPTHKPPQLNDAELPVYSVLVPLFRETRVLDQLIEALCRLDYPALGSIYRNGPAI